MSNPNHPMKHMVLGFMLDKTLQHVLMIEKHTEKPEQQWQNGLLNGTGGGVEDYEGSHQAMAREHLEETGIDTNLNDWLFCGIITDNFYFHVSVFIHTEYDIHKLKSAAQQAGENDIPKVCYTPLVLSHWHNLADDVSELITNCLWVYKMLMKGQVRQFKLICG